MANKKEMPKVAEDISSKSTNPEDNSEKHQIETYIVGTPGQEKTVCDSLNFGQVSVQELTGAEIAALGQKISCSEKESMSSLANQDIVTKGQEAKKITEKSKKLAEDIAELSGLFKNAAHEFLAVNPKGLEIPGKADYCFIMCEKYKDEVQKELKKLGYTIINSEHKGFSAKSELSELFFMYAVEKHKEKKAA